MRQRIITALWLIPLGFAVIWFAPSWGFSFLVAVAAVLGAFEFYQLVTRSGGQPLTIFGLTWTLLFTLNAHFSADFDRSYIEPLFALAVILPLVWLLFRPREKAFNSWAWTLAGILYIGWMLSHYVLLRGLAQGKEWVIFVIFSTAICDSAAFFVGRTWGRDLLAPAISPKKTWQGAAAGFVATIIAALIVNTVLRLIGYGEAILLGCLIGVFAQLGDLTESLFKRSVAAKDSGGILPGHGGILDRIDSIAFAGVIVYYYLIWTR